jgi:hypothetical protein
MAHPTQRFRPEFRSNEKGTNQGANALRISMPIEMAEEMSWRLSSECLRCLTSAHIRTKSAFFSRSGIQKKERVSKLRWCNWLTNLTISRADSTHMSRYGFRDLVVVGDG